ncbi:MAG TPA: pyridoxamine 5'-phosphate oxidase family protein [Methylomirabilota bacterium]|jgi:nitroimidazol reductase NimA-like FMN-containing flavoprotein (pyridoxamine 5'-phosphate oxidase superfamily)|nr:pyridoxamine 5'-phosphate oxidase family protein [Methylomirabilota bacterium]
MARLTKKPTEFLTRARVVRVATADGRGIPHVVPVCPVFADGRLYFGSSNDARKVQNLRANPQITVVADDYTEAWDGLRGVMVTGKASLHARGPKFRKARQLLYEKFPQYEAQAALGVGDSVVIEVTPTRVFAWGFE